MKRIVYLLFLLLLPLHMTAQKKEISQAKANIKSGKSLDQAEQAMRKLLADSTNRNNEKIWLTLFDAVRKQYEQGNEKLYLKQGYDTAQLFTLTKKMFLVLEGFDSLDAAPNSKGVSAPSYRKRHAAYLNDFRPNLYNGGLFFANKQKYGDAYPLFDSYIDCARQPLFSAYQYADSDKDLCEAAYWAVFCGYKMQDPERTLRYATLALCDTAHYNLTLQYLAETYKLQNDIVRYVATLHDGFARYPLFPFFFPRLVSYYGELSDWNRVDSLSTLALRADSTNQTFLFAKSTALLNLGKYDECVALCDQIIRKDSLFPDAYYNAGLAYYRRAESLSKLPLTAERKQKIQSNYALARPYMEAYRKLKPDEGSQWSLMLYNIYLNLNMGKEFDEIDAYIRKNKGN
ncbi:MAG: hypothetical protein IJS97_02935 [Prevotella sp.]|nr:hypothetical protein [Prevotella sp.]